MAQLDASQHSLNTSTSKQKYSFPRGERFKNNSRLLCDSYYQAPSTRTSRTTSFGYGNKDLGIRQDKYIPPIGTYQLGSQFKKNQKKGFSFGSGRQEMDITGPLKDVKLQSYIPGPGNYPNRSMLDNKAPTLKSRLPDRSFSYMLKNPGPGTYDFQQIGGKMYYATSKYRNYTNHKISQGTRLQNIGRRSTEVGPGTYSVHVEDLNPQGRYHLSNHENSKTRLFDRSARQQLVHKHMVTNPGPGQYPIFSSFG